MKYVCPICGYVYDEEKEGKPFSELPESWVCPLCGAAKSVFTALEAKKEEKSAAADFHIDEDMKKLGAGELSAICSNLARGCEKQYKDREAALFREIADWFAAAAPAVPESGLAELSKLVDGDLASGVSALRSVAVEDSDRGTQRICVWGEKVTNIVSSLLRRYEKEGEEFLKNTNVWVCSVCGFIYVGDKAPELCPVCKVPSWKFEKVDGRVSA